MPTSFKNSKDLRFVITLGTGSFGSSNNNQIILEGFRSVANINKAGGQMMGELTARIYGVSQSDMNAATTLQWKPQGTITNSVSVYAVDGQQVTLVFMGNIINAWGDYNSQPDVFLMIQAQSANVAQMTPVAPTAFAGQTDAATVFQQLASGMGFSFENNGVNVQLRDVYLPNTALEQTRDLARAANCSIYVDNGTLAITPLNVPRNMPQIPSIGPDTGLVGYPTFDGVGVNFRTVFNPAVLFGGSVSLTTSITLAQGTWLVTSVAHNLSGQMPDGPWFSQIRGNKTGMAL